jgi:hypothetical protein
VDISDLRNIKMMAEPIATCPDIASGYVPLIPEFIRVYKLQFTKDISHLGVRWGPSSLIKRLAASSLEDRVAVEDKIVPPGETE